MTSKLEPKKSKAALQARTTEKARTSKAGFEGDFPRLPELSLNTWPFPKKMGIRALDHAKMDYKTYK